MTILLTAIEKWSTEEERNRRPGTDYKNDDLRNVPDSHFFWPTADLEEEAVDGEELEELKTTNALQMEQ